MALALPSSTARDINTSPNVSINDGPFIEWPWLYPTGVGAFGGWTLP